jgi:hypothetical protein
LDVALDAGELDLEDDGPELVLQDELADAEV